MDIKWIRKLFTTHFKNQRDASIYHNVSFYSNLFELDWYKTSHMSKITYSASQYFNLWDFGRLVDMQHNMFPLQYRSAPKSFWLKDAENYD